jgi:solute carrier family 35 protein E3
VLLTGVYLYSVNDVELNALGSIIAVIAVILTAGFQLSGQIDQAKFSISGPQIQHASAFPQFVLCLASAICSEVLNPRHCILDHSFTVIECVLIVMTAVIAVSVNVSFFGIIGKTSALTYQVIGHVKTMLILFIGFLFFPPKEPMSRPQMVKTTVGMFISMIGIVLYSAFGLVNKANEDKQREPSVFKEKEAEERPPETPLPPNLFVGTETEDEEAKKVTQ